MSTDNGTASKGLHGYGKVWSYDDAPVRQMFRGSEFVDIEEKVDGSQFSCGLVDGELVMRSKGAQVFPGPGMFEAAVASAERMQLAGALLPNAVYRFEYLSKPKHNTLAYERVPAGNLVLYDVEIDGEFVPAEMLPHYASALGVDAVPLLYSGSLPSRDELDGMLDTDAMLGGHKVEGIVVKDRTRRHLQDGKMLKAKVVSDAFKEKHNKGWKAKNLTGKDVADEIAQRLRTEARFAKAVQRARDGGNPANTVQAIGPLLADLGRDLKAEHEDWIKAQLFKHYWPQIQRRANAGFPEWFKAEMAKGEA